MSLNLHWINQAQDISSRKTNATTQPPIFFNNPEIKLSFNQKDSGLTLDNKLSFNEYMNYKIHQANKGVCLLWKLQWILPCTSLVTTSKSFIRPLLDYVDVIYDQPSNALFAKKIKLVHYNAGLPKMGITEGSSCEKLYLELGLEYIR